MDQHDIVGKKRPRCEIPGAKADLHVESKTGKLEAESVKEKAWKRSKPRTTNSLKKGHKCRIRNHEGKRAPERKGKGRLECRQRKHGRDMYEAAGMRDERLGFSNQATSVPVNIGS